ncbi:hypothetical protein D3C80_1292730 [compost metagenome]
MGDDPVTEVRCQGQLGRPAHQQALLVGKEGVVRAYQAGLRRFGAVDAQGGPAHQALVNPWQQVGDFLLCRSNLRCRLARYAIGFRQVAAEVPHPLAIGCRVGGYRHPWLGPATEAVGVQRFEVRALGHDHVQRACLHGGLVQAQRLQQTFGAGSGAQHDALGTDFPVIHAQADQGITFTQWFDTLTCKQGVAGQLGQVGQQARDIDHQFCQAIDLTLEGAVLQRGRQLVALDLVDPAAHGLAGEETGEVAGQGAG